MTRRMMSDVMALSAMRCVSTSGAPHHGAVPGSGRRGVVAVLLALTVWGGAADAAVTMSVDPPTVQVPQSGASANVCVNLTGAGGRAAGTQNDLTWDGDCATLVRCAAAPGNSKPLSANVLPGSHFTLRAFMLSLGDTHPMNDGALYCCTFRVDLAEAGSCCSVSMSNARWSDSGGRGEGASVSGGQLCVAGGGASSGTSGTSGGSQGGFWGGPVTAPGVPVAGGPPPTAAKRGAGALGGAVPAPTPDLPPIGGMAAPEMGESVAVQPAQQPAERPADESVPSEAAPVAGGAVQVTPARSPSAAAAVPPAGEAAPAAAVSPERSPSAAVTPATTAPTKAATKAAVKAPTKAAAPPPTKSGCEVSPGGGGGAVLAGLLALVAARGRGRRGRVR